LDEPTANLDPQGVADYRRIVTDAARDGTTVVVSSHILAEVSRVSTSVGILAAGRFIARGSWKALAAELASSTAGGTTIFVETRDPMPEISHTEIASIAYSSDRHEATIVARTDIRDDIADILAAHGVRIHALAARERSLEEIFLSYASAGD